MHYYWQSNIINEIYFYNIINKVNYFFTKIMHIETNRNNTLPWKLTQQQSHNNKGYWRTPNIKPTFPSLPSKLSLEAHSLLIPITIIPYFLNPLEFYREWNSIIRLSMNLSSTIWSSCCLFAILVFVCVMCSRGTDRQKDIHLLNSNTIRQNNMSNVDPKNALQQRTEYWDTNCIEFVFIANGYEYWESVSMSVFPSLPQ